MRIMHLDTIPMQLSLLGIVLALVVSFGLVSSGCSSQDSISDRRERARSELERTGSDSDFEDVAEDVAEEDEEPTVLVEEEVAEDVAEEDEEPTVLVEEEDEVDELDEPPRRAGSRASGVLDDLRELVAISKQEAREYARIGDSFFSQAQYDEAAKNYRMALDRDPELETARRGYNQALQMTGDRIGELGSVSKDIRQRSAVRQDFQRAEIRRNMEEGRKALAAGDVEEAERRVGQAVDSIELTPDFPARERNEATMLLERIRREKLVRADQRRQQELVEAQSAADLAVDQENVVRYKKVQLLLRKTRGLMRLKQYRNAVETCDRILDLDPSNRVAKFWRSDARDQIVKQRRFKLISDRLENRALLLENVTEAGIPYNAFFLFPDAEIWDRARGRREHLQFESVAEPEAVKAIKNILATLPVDLVFEDIPLSDAVDQLRDLLGINIGIDPEVSAEDTNVSLDVRGLVAGNALNLLLARAGLNYTFRENILFITPEGSASGDTNFRIYNVRDILNKIRNFQGPELLLRDPNDTAEGGESISFTADIEEVDTTLDPEMLQELIQESTGGEDTWGETNTMDYHNGNLLVTASTDMHEKIDTVLENLRKDSDLFVVVESRFIDITDDFLEDIGIDSRALGVDNNWGTPFGNVLNDTRTGGQDLGFVKQGSPVRDVTLIQGFDRWAGRVQHIVDGFTGSFKQAGRLNAGGGIGGLTVQQTWLEPFQINTILRAVQERADIRTLTAPVVTAANGQRVFVSVITQRAYIADYELVSGGTGFAIIEVADPVVQTFQEGVILDVQPVISHDKKYITLDVRPTLAVLIGGSISTINISLGSFTNVAFMVPIGVPEISLQQSFTSVIVPNGGTVLLGGFKSLSELKARSYIPILGDIPVIGFLFRRKTTFSEKRSLIILMSARIVDLRGEEARRFNAD